MKGSFSPSRHRSVGSTFHFLSSGREFESCRHGILPAFLLFASLTLTAKKSPLLVCILPPAFFCRQINGLQKTDRSITAPLDELSKNTLFTSLSCSHDLLDEIQSRQNPSLIPFDYLSLDILSLSL